MILSHCIYKQLCSSLPTYKTTTVGLPQYHEDNKVSREKNYLPGRIKASVFLIHFCGTIKCMHIKECTIHDLS